MSVNIPELVKDLSRSFKPHPWHGIEPQAGMGFLTVYIEIVPTDGVKFELDKDSGYLMVDRPQKYSNYIPALYGFIPRTYSAEGVAAYASKKMGGPALKGDGDPIDICVLSEKPITHGDLLLKARPIGGFRMIDEGEVDDKIVAVLKDDAIYGGIKDIRDCPELIIKRLKHYFLTYKEIPGDGPQAISIEATYGPSEAQEIIELSFKDYEAHYVKA